MKLTIRDIVVRAHACLLWTGGCWQAADVTVLRKQENDTGKRPTSKNLIKGLEENVRKVLETKRNEYDRVHFQLQQKQKELAELKLQLGDLAKDGKALGLDEFPDEKQRLGAIRSISNRKVFTKHTVRCCKVLCCTVAHVVLTCALLLFLCCARARVFVCVCVCLCVCLCVSVSVSVSVCLCLCLCLCTCIPVHRPACCAPGLRQSVSAKSSIDARPKCPVLIACRRLRVKQCQGRSQATPWPSKLSMPVLTLAMGMPRLQRCLQAMEVQCTQQLWCAWRHGNLRLRLDIAGTLSPSSLDGDSRLGCYAARVLAACSTSAVSDCVRRQCVPCGCDSGL